MPIRPSRLALASLLSLLLAVGAPAAPARAASDDLRVDRGELPALVDVFEVYGSHLEGWNTRSWTGTASHDGGKTWTDVFKNSDQYYFAMPGGVIVTELGGQVEVRSLVDGSKKTYDLTSQGSEIASLNTTQALMSDQYLITYEGLARRDLPTVEGGLGVEWSKLLPNGYVVGTSSTGALWSLSPSGTATQIATSGSGSFDWVTNWGDNIAYSTGSGDPCLRTVAGTQIGCSPYLDSSEYEIESTGTGFLVNMDDSKLVWLPLVGGTLQASRTVTLGADVQGFRLASHVEGSMPVVTTVTATGSYVELLDTTAMTLSRTATDVKGPGATPTALTPTTLLLQDEQYGQGTWQRSVGSSIGAANSLSSLNENRSSAQASAGRWLVPTGTAALTLYDRGVAKETLSNTDYAGEYSIRGISGPNLMVDRAEQRQVRNAAGTWTTVADALGIFGGLVLEDLTDEDADPVVYRYRVRDLSGGGSPTIEFTAPSQVTQWWGDTVAYEDDSACVDPEQDATRVYNFRTRTTVFSTCGDLVALGDGFVVVSAADATLTAVNFATGAKTSLDGLAGQRVAVDGNRIAYATETELVVTTIAGVATSAPRSLGVKAPASYTGVGVWTPEIDLTKPVGAGNLVIKNSAGSTVRTLAVPASPDGSIRGVGWDGKDAAGEVVPKGSYTIALTNVAVDGSGGVVRTDGSAAPLASVSVNIPTIGASTPTIAIDGALKIGAKLTANPGTWTPAPVALSYQWNRDGQAITAATGSTYTVVPADANAKLTVTVTGRSGRLIASRTSAATAVVPGSALSKTPVPKISGTAKVGRTLTAKPGTWKPSGVKLGYQWYRGTTPIDGANARTYKLVGDDKGARIAVRVTGTKTGYTTVTKASKATKKIAPGTLTKPKVKISGTAKVGSVLTVNPGTWKPAPVVLAYQWYASGRKISGATATTYTLTAAEKGKRITVKVTATKPGYSTASRTSSRTAVVKA